MPRCTVSFDGPAGWGYIRAESSRRGESCGASRGPRLAGPTPPSRQIVANKKRVVCFVDGFNLYHALHGLALPHLKWLDLRKLITTFIDPDIHDLTSVYYFSAFATWLPAPYARHQQFVAAIMHNGVTAVMGKFKQKPRACNRCGASWMAHEEKETDVNIAVYILRGAHRDEYDELFVLTGDSDIGPALRMVRSDYPTKRIKVIATPGRRQSKELAAAAHTLAAIKQIHLERSLLPPQVVDGAGLIVATRPPEYKPPR